MEFKVGEQVVHPKYGLGHVVKLEQREFEPGMMRQYYEISMQGGSTLWVSSDLPTFGLRKLTVKSEISRCRKILESHPSPLIQDVRQRQSAMSDRLKQGTITAHCEVVRDLHAHFAHQSPTSKIGAFL